MEARDLQKSLRAQRQAAAAAKDRDDFQRVLKEARRQEAETKRLVRLKGSPPSTCLCTCCCHTSRFPTSLLVILEQAHHHQVRRPTIAGKTNPVHAHQTL